MKRHLLLLLMVMITLLTAATFSVSVHAFRAQESAMDAMMRSYVLDLAENFSNTAAFTGGRGQAQRHGMSGMMRFRMLSADRALQSPDAGGILVITREGRILTASPGAERLLPLWKDTAAGGEPRETRDLKGDSYYVAVRELQDGNFVLAAVSRTFLLAPLTGVWKFWILSAMATSAAVLVGMFLLWRWLAVPLRRIVERIRSAKWGKEPSIRFDSGPLSELEALSSVIGRLAAEAFEKEELKIRYVNDLVQVQETTKAQLASELHDGALQSTVAAIKRIQLAKKALPEDVPPPLLGHLDTAEEVVQAAANEIRSYCEELAPSWARLGLSPALEENANRISKAYDGVEIDVEIDMGLEDEYGLFPEEHVLALSRIFQEAASNSVRHGGARFIQVELRKEENSILFSIQDDGSGFDTESYAGTDYELLRTTGHRGLANINERVRLLHGTMRVNSRPGEGCRIDIAFPAPSLRTGEETNHSQQTH
jgi:signal transduction histidine kinase